MCSLLIGNAAASDGADLYGVTYGGQAESAPATVNGKRLSEVDLRAVEFVAGNQHGGVQGPDPVDLLIEQELFIQYAAGNSALQDNASRHAIESLFLSNLGMEYFDRRLKQGIAYDAAEITAVLPARWVKASVEFVVYPSIDEAMEAAAKVKTLEDFEALKKSRPQAVKAQDNLFPASGFFPDFDDVAIFNMKAAGVYGALETGIGPAVLYVKEIGEVAEDQKGELLQRAEETLRWKALSKEMERIQAAYPVEVAVDNVRRYLHGLRGGYVLVMGIGTVGGRTVDTTVYRMLTKKEPLAYMKNAGEENLVAEYENSVRNVCRTIALGEDARTHNYPRIETGQYERSFNNLKRRYYAAAGEQLAVGEISVSDELVKQYYEDNLKREFRLPERVRVAQIYVEGDRKKLVEARKKLKEGASFDDTAQQYSEDFHSRMKGGDIGWVFRNGSIYPEAEKAIFAKKAGGVTGIVKTPKGYHIFKVDRFEPARTLTLEESRPLIRKKIYDARYEEKRARVLKKLKKEARIERAKSAPAKSGPAKGAPAKSGSSTSAPSTM